MHFDDIRLGILKSAHENHFAGFDPFDGLNGTLFKFLPRLKNTNLGLAFIQLGKLSPINFRRILGVKPARNPKGVALFISGLLFDFKKSGNQFYLDQALALGEWLVTQKCDLNLWRYPCWGYHFDWKARAFFVPKGKPNVITTIYVCHALYDLGVAANRHDLMQIALDGADFIVESLYTEESGRSFFAYIPGETAFVHNASLWGAAWVAFSAKQTGNMEYRELALKVARQSVSEQASDGSWVYGARHHHQFIDGFHTGYNLEALHEIRMACGVDEFDEAITKGLSYYKQHLFDSDGTAKYYHNNRYPLDMHSVAQAIITLIRVGGRPEDIVQAKKVLNWSIDTLYLPEKGHFCYQINRHYKNKINYVRWTQAWVYYSFSLFSNYLAEQNASR